MQYFRSSTTPPTPIPFYDYISPRNAFTLPRENGIIAPPSAALLDVAYGIAALNAWAPEAFKTRCRVIMKPYYYPEAPNISREDKIMPPNSGPSGRQRRWEKRKERTETHGGTDADAGYDYFDMILGLRSLGMREQRERAEREKKRVNETMVDKWRGTVNY